MEITVFAKKKKTREGRQFYAYITHLTRKTGEEQAMAVKFRDECGAPKPENCPMNVVVEKGDANISKKTYTREDTGEPAVSYTMWVTNWREGAPYVDTSFDDFEV